MLFFGHGLTDELTGTYGLAAVDKANVAAAAGKAVVAVACLPGRSLGPDAVTAGVTAFLGWNIKLLWLTPPAGQLGRFGSAIVDSLETLDGRVTIGGFASYVEEQWLPHHQMEARTR